MRADTDHPRSDAHATDDHTVPVSSTVVPQVIAAVADTRSSLTAVADVVGTDAGLAAAVLAVANSAAFGRSRRVNDLPTAVNLIGADLVQTLAIAGATDLLDGAGGLPHLRRHAIETACAARLLAALVGLPESDAFAAGLLHDVGEVLLWHDDPAGYGAARQGWDDVDAQLWEERHRFGNDHANAAREQLARWRLPGAVVDAVGDHHRPDLSHRDLSTVVAAADDLVTAAGGEPDPDRLGVGVDVLERVHASVVAQSDDMVAALSTSRRAR